MNDYKDEEYEIDLLELVQHLWKHVLVLAARSKYRRRHGFCFVNIQADADA